MKVFILTFLCLSAGGNANIHCVSYASRSKLSGVKLHYECYNYKHLPTDLQYPHSTSKLTLVREANNLNVLRKRDLFDTNLVNLKELTLTSVNIKAIEVGAFIGGTNLRVLDLSSNEIETLNLTVFKDTPSLESLRLDGNKLKIFADIFPPLNLTFLSLQSCELKTLDWRVLKPLKSLDAIQFENNPFHCDCKIKFLFEYLNKTNTKFDKDLNYCASGFGNSKNQNNNQLGLANLTGITLDELDFQLLLCPATITSFRNDNLEETLECKYSGHPEPVVKWTKNGTELLDLQTGVLNGDPDFEEFNYQFKQVLDTLNNTGKYECFVSNKAGSDSKTISLGQLTNSETSFDQMTTISPPDTGLNDWIDFKIVALTFFVVLLAVILISGVIYIAVRYSKTKARLLKTKIYREVKDNSRSSEPKSQVTLEELPYPPLLQNGTEEPIYEVIDEDVNGYEIPISLQQPPKLPQRNQSDNLD